MVVFARKQAADLQAGDEILFERVDASKLQDEEAERLKEIITRHYNETGRLPGVAMARGVELDTVYVRVLSVVYDPHRDCVHMNVQDHLGQVHYQEAPANRVVVLRPALPGGYTERTFS